MAGEPVLGGSASRAISIAGCPLAWALGGLHCGWMGGQEALALDPICVAWCAEPEVAEDVPVLRWAVVASGVVSEVASAKAQQHSPAKTPRRRSLGSGSVPPSPLARSDSVPPQRKASRQQLRQVTFAEAGARRGYEAGGGAASARRATRPSLDRTPMRPQPEACADRGDDAEPRPARESTEDAQASGSADTPYRTDCEPVPTPRRTSPRIGAATAPHPRAEEATSSRELEQPVHRQRLFRLVGGTSTPCLPTPRGPYDQAGVSTPGLPSPRNPYGPPLCGTRTAAHPPSTAGGSCVSSAGVCGVYPVDLVMATPPMPRPCALAANWGAMPLARQQAVLVQAIPANVHILDSIVPAAQVFHSAASASSLLGMAPRGWSASATSLCTPQGQWQVGVAAGTASTNVIALGSAAAIALSPWMPQAPQQHAGMVDVSRQPQLAAHYQGTSTPSWSPQKWPTERRNYQCSGRL